METQRPAPKPTFDRLPKWVCDVRLAFSSASLHASPKVGCRLKAPLQGLVLGPTSPRCPENKNKAAHPSKDPHEYREAVADRIVMSGIRSCACGSQLENGRGVGTARGAKSGSTRGMHSGHALRARTQGTHSQQALRVRIRYMHSGHALGTRTPTTLSGCKTSHHKVQNSTNIGLTGAP